MSVLTRRSTFHRKRQVDQLGFGQFSKIGRATREKPWKVAGLVVSIGLITFLMYYAEVRTIPAGQLYRQLFIFPIALAAYSFGLSGGLTVALSCTLMVFPILVKYVRWYESYEVVEVLSTIIVFNLLAFIIANLADFQRKQERLRLILVRISGLFEKGLDAEQLSAEILSTGIEVCHAEFGEVVLRDKITNELQTVAQHGFMSTGFMSIDQEVHSNPVVQGTPLAEWLLAENQALLVNDVDRDTRFRRQPGAPPVGSLLAVPLRNGEVIGYVALMNKQAGMFTSDDLETLTAIVEKSQVAIENARLYEQTDEKLHERLREFASLTELSTSLSATLDLNQTLDAAITHAAQALEASMCDIRLVESDQLTMVACAGSSDKAVSQAVVKIEGRLQQMIQERQPLAIADLEHEAALPVGWLRWAGRASARSYLGLPLISQDCNIGILSIYRQEPHAWSAHEITFASMIAHTVSSAVANAQSFEDISDRKRWTELVLHGIGDGVVTTDRECRIQTFNTAAEQIIGRSGTELAGHYLCEVFGARDECAKRPGGRPCPHRRALSQSTSNPYVYKTSFTHPDGVDLTLASTTASLSNQQGELLGTVTIFRDISKEERLDRMKTDFVSMVSHELRAPLTNIMASVNLLSGDQLGPQDEWEVIDILSSQSRRLNRFVEDILSVSRLDAEELEVELQPVTLAPLVWRTIDATREKQMSHKFEVYIPRNLPYVRADESKLEIVLQNLLANAGRHSSPGSTITVEAHLDGRNVVVSISDEGSGISPEDQEHVFERFYRGSTAGSQHTDGHGLGLYFCKRLVEAQGGHIWVESKLGVGSRFSLLLQPFDIEEEREA